MHQIFIDESQIEGKKILVTGEDYHHIRNVLRMKPGEEISVIPKTPLSDGEGNGKELRCLLNAYHETEREAELTLIFVKEADIELPCRIYLFQGLPKGDKMELIIQKAVELGVFSIIPVAMRRSVVRLSPERERKRIERYQAIAAAAAGQAKRGIIPEVTGVRSFTEALRYAEEQEIGVRLLPYELSDQTGMDRTRRIFSDIRPGDKIAVFIGPEGGFDEEETGLAVEKGFQEITLGKRILRTETAGLTVLSWLVFLLEGRN
ncbi:MAG: 16S rRNA (uracil(1498)-N(3))-methyltransferase [Lachnospiraceae bacterium]|nr:16S rRNA (uracil(1498)-N(3))-methyltransferase [Lachnospiraceae bacterium]